LTQSATSIRAVRPRRAGFGDAPAARGLEIERQQIEVGPFQQVGRLAARRRAGIEHMAARGRREQCRGQLRARILHRHQAIGKARQGVDRDRTGQRQSAFADRVARYRRRQAGDSRRAQSAGH
jgi:hypothetical protein